MQSIIPNPVAFERLRNKEEQQEKTQIVAICKISFKYNKTENRIYTGVINSKIEERLKNHTFNIKNNSQMAGLARDNIEISLKIKGMNWIKW